MAKVEYASINLPKEILEELKLWKQAFSNAKLRPVSYGEMIDTMLKGLKTIQPEVAAEMTRMIENHPELKHLIHNTQSNG